MPNIIIKNYEHINTAFKNWNTPKGRYIKNKDDYDRAMKEEGMIPSEKTTDNRKFKEYKLSDKGRAIIEAAKNSKDSRGNVKLSDRTIEAMKDIGAIGKKIPKHSKLPGKLDNGGFYTI